MTKEEILNMPATKTWKIKELLKLGLNRKEVAIEVGTNYGMVQNVFAKLYPDKIKSKKEKPTILGFAEKLLELEMITWSQNIEGLMKRANKQSEKIFGIELRTKTFDEFIEDLFNKKRPELVEEEPETEDELNQETEDELNQETEEVIEDLTEEELEEEEEVLQDQELVEIEI